MFLIFKEFEKMKLLIIIRWLKLSSVVPSIKCVRKKQGWMINVLAQRGNVCSNTRCDFTGEEKFSKLSILVKFENRNNKDARVTSFIRNITIHVRRSGSVEDFLADPPHTPRCVRLGLRAANNL